jgi:hypothetical protein
LYEANQDERSPLLAEEINKYTKMHKLNVEGIYDKYKKDFLLNKVKVDSEEEKNDNISHFICRLAYCRLDDLKKWFVT